MTTNANQPAFPTQPVNFMDKDGPAVVYGSAGLTKRELFAAMAMQGALSDSRTIDRIFEKYGAERGYVELSICSVKQADALLAELEKGEK